MKIASSSSNFVPASTKIPEREGSLSPSSFYGQLTNNKSHFLAFVPSRWVLLFVFGFIEQNEKARLI